MDKSPDAFRTISEVAEVLETPAHVLRFWESRFPQIRPVKRAGGRRYYRPADVALLTGIKRLLHDEGLTIRGVQKILREQGVRHVAGLSGEVIVDEADDAEAALEAALAANFGTDTAEPAPQAEVETAQIVALETALRERVEPAPDAPPAEVVVLFDPRTEELPPVERTPEVPPDATLSAIEAVMEEAPEAAHWLDPELAADTESPAPALPLLDRLRALPAGYFAGVTEVQALHAQLRALQARVEAPAPRLPL
jgi:DNA-binding transcriptional MerR regulator